VRICTLQVIKDWKWEWPGNEASAPAACCWYIYQGLKGGSDSVVAKTTTSRSSIVPHAHSQYSQSVVG